MFRIGWKKALVAVALGAALVVNAGLSPGVAEAANANVEIVVDGQKLLFDVPPQVDSERTLAPMRTVFEGLGADVRWEAATRTAVATKDGITIRMPIGNKTVTRNGENVTLDVPAKLVESRTMVPVRFISEAFGNTVSWDAVRRIVYVKSANQPAVRVVGADGVVQDAQLQSGNQLMKNGLLGQVEKEVGLTFKQPVWVFLTNSNGGYEKAIQWYGRESRPKVVANYSLGVTYGSIVVVPMQKNASTMEFKMTMAHELVHVLLNQNGGSSLPSWVHEGMAWEVGTNLAFVGQPDVLKKSVLGLNRSDVLHAVEAGNYQPLIDGVEYMDDDHGYNVQAQDHLAYRYALTQFGREKFMAYLTGYMKGEHQAFSKALGLSTQQFENQFYAYLQSEMKKKNQGVELKVQVTDPRGQEFALLPQGSSTWHIFNLASGIHTIRMYHDGHVEGVPVAEQWDDENEPSAEMAYLSIHTDTAVKQHGVSATEGGVVLHEAFGEYFLNNIWLNPEKGDSVYPKYANQLLGIEVLDVATIE
jgi:hypothetical protein